MTTQEKSDLKSRLLAEAAKKTPHKYEQFDGFSDLIEDSVMRPDPEGDTIFSSWCWELRSGGIPVRVQILAGTSKADSIRLLRKILDCIERSNAARLDGEPTENTDVIEQRERLIVVEAKIDEARAKLDLAAAIWRKAAEVYQNEAHSLCEERENLLCNSGEWEAGR